jgi:hypothetical protein
LLEAFQHARDQGYNGFVVDNVMKLGVAEDDMAGHGVAANAFADFAIGQAAHVFMVNHLKKGDGAMRNRSRGSLRWVDSSSNVVGIERNEKKWETIQPLKDKMDRGIMSHKEFMELTADERKQPDAKFILMNQRFQGTWQNGSKALWFLARGSQYFDHNDALPAAPVNWLDVWTEEKKRKARMEE